MSLDISAISKPWHFAQNHMLQECVSAGYSRPWRRRQWDPYIQVVCLQVRPALKQHEELGFEPIFFMLLDPELAEDPEEARRMNRTLDVYPFYYEDRQRDDWYPVTVKDDDDAFDIEPPSMLKTLYEFRCRQQGRQQGRTKRWERRSSTLSLDGRRQDGHSRRIRQA